jgi:hypothetical protein
LVDEVIEILEAAPARPGPQLPARPGYVPPRCQRCGEVLPRSPVKLPSRWCSVKHSLQERLAHHAECVARLLLETRWAYERDRDSVEARWIPVGPPVKVRGRSSQPMNQLLDLLKTSSTEAVIAFGAGAHQVVDLWPGASGLFVAKPLHPSFREDGPLRANWNTFLPQLRTNVTPDPGVTPDSTPYAGNTFKKADLANIPARDLPFGVPKWMGTGDMAWRTSTTQITWKSLAADG